MWPSWRFRAIAPDQYVGQSRSNIACVCCRRSLRLLRMAYRRSLRVLFEDRHTLLIRKVDGCSLNAVEHQGRSGRSISCIGCLRRFECGKGLIRFGRSPGTVASSLLRCRACWPGGCSLCQSLRLGSRTAPTKGFRLPHRRLVVAIVLV
ncbi:hypothetical protein CALVIDRAFT_131087 [Calocera viscosa TUFC12733]|uniref:Uncharacterized protein n=1 Tax=Calocera viscosa (strain TUFC12733) TaxID=1330018 RepID=A0A167RUM8_CALVF|nr:hypothetical protein CALVIDRAFT_131087 [Calocera viscosa TUFC12733]